MKNALEIHSVLNVCGEAHRLHRGEAAVIAGDGTVNLAVRSAVAVAALLGVGEAAASLLLLWEGPLGETRAVEQRSERRASKSRMGVGEDQLPHNFLYSLAIVGQDLPE